MATVRAKKKCCKDKPRCQKCPVVLMRLEKLGYAQRTGEGKREYRLDGKVPKKVLVLARQR